MYRNFEICSQASSVHPRKESEVWREGRQNGAGESFMPILTWVLMETLLEP